MSAKVILPDFRLPGEAPRPAVRALWVAGGMMVVATFVLGGALWHRHSVDLAAQSAPAKVLAVAAQQQQMAAEPARPAEPAPTASPVALADVAAPDEAPAAPAATTLAPTSVRHRAGGHRHHGAHAAKAGHAKALAVRGTSESRGSKNSSAKKKDDAIDQLLKQFK